MNNDETERARPGPAARFSPAARVALLSTLTLGLLLVVELAARGGTWTAPSGEGQGVQPVFSASALGDWAPGVRGPVLSRLESPFFFNSNDAGFRNLDPFDVDAVRVLVLGDSQTFGQYVSNHDIWTRIAQRKWNSERATRVQLLNAGIPGATIVDQLAYLTEKGARLAPDVILLAVYQNDVPDLLRLSTSSGATRSELKRHASDVWFDRGRRFLSEHSGMYALARQLKDDWLRGRAAGEVAAVRGAATAREHPPAPGTPDETSLSDLYRSLMMEAVAKAQALGAVVGVIHIAGYAQPSDDSRAGEVSRAVAEAEGLPYLDLRETYDRHAAYDLYLVDPIEAARGYPSDTHLSRFGHRLTGFAVADFLEAVLPLGVSAGS